MAPDPAAEPLLALAAGRRGHFRMESGYHSERWFELGRLFDRPERLRPFVATLAQRLARHRVEAVCGAMSGGARLAELLAAELGVASCFTERFAPAQAGGMFPVRYQIPAAQRATVRGRRVAVVDDAFSAGSAARATYADLLACGARPAAFGALLVFGDAMPRFAAELNLPLEAAARVDFRMWLPADCPAQRARVALEAVAEA